MSFSVCWVKNISGGPLDLRHYFSANNEEYQIPDSVRTGWANDSNVIGAITSDDIQIGNGSEYYTDHNQQINYLKGLVSPKDTDGSDIIQPKTTKLGWHYQPEAMSWTTSKLGSVYAKDWQGNDLGDTALKFYNSSDVELTQGAEESDEDFQTRLTANCVMTCLDWQAAYDQDIIGAILQVKSAPAQSAYAWALIAPDLDPQYGGQVPYLQGGWDISYFADKQTVHLDGRGAKRLSYDSEYNTNKIRLIVRHGAGAQIPLQVVWEHFRA